MIVNKIDIASREQVMAMLSAAVDARRRGVLPGVGQVRATASTRSSSTSGSLLPEGPKYFPDDEVSDMPEEQFVAELVREQLLAVTRDELPYSIATRVTEWEWPRIRVDIIVERDSQKGMVIGKGGSVLKEVGERARAQLPEGVYLELRVKVDKDWQRKTRAGRAARLLTGSLGRAPALSRRGDGRLVERCVDRHRSSGTVVRRVVVRGRRGVGGASPAAPRSRRTRRPRRVR